jgi:HJR/Mrr/RecB family endonuclease
MAIVYALIMFFIIYMGFYVRKGYILQVANQEETKKENEYRTKLEYERVNAVILNNQEYIDKYVLIAERKVYKLDEYGDEVEIEENLTKEVDNVLNKIFTKENLIFGDEFYIVVRRELRQYLRLHLINCHKYRNNRKYTEMNFQDMSGTDFEIYVSQILKEKGYVTSITGKTGDQGADLIVEKEGRRIIVQAKCYSQSVGNKAVQEVIGAVGFYDGDEGCVITNSSFTRSAIALARKNNITLIDGFLLSRFIDEGDMLLSRGTDMIRLQSGFVDTPEIETGSIGKIFDPTLDLSNYKFPTLDLLDEQSDERVKYDPEELERNKNQIISTLNNYQIEISKIKATIGPTVTLYEIVPAPGVRISRIKNLEDDIALSLAALGIRIIAPIPGKGTIGIEVPNANKEVVSMRSLLASEKFQNSTADLPICLGKSISNEIIVADLAKMPHLLMAGATGQGKSVGINSILVSLLYKKHPSQLKFIMVDPKKVELSLYELLEKHFLAKLPGEADAIITDTKKVVTTLNALCIEMDQRYDLLKKAQVRNIKEYNHKFINRQLNPANGHTFLPYIVLVVDEFADLIMTEGKEIEMPIARLAQLAPPIGIHLILATQRPSVNIITGTIKANFPARIAFKTTSKIDSRTILDAGGSEQLIGRGDMLLSQGSDMIRLQCGFVDTPEVERIRDFIANQQGYPEAFLLPEYIDPNDKSAGDDFLSDGEKDGLFEDAARIIVQNQMGSTSLIQRRLKLGYNRAGRLMDQLEEAGIVGENAGSKAREVKFKTEMELDHYLQKIRE